MEIKQWGNRYTFLNKVGDGAYGTVYKIKDLNGPEGQGSIKILKEISVRGMQKDEIDECAREGKLLSKLSHSYIVQFFDSFCFMDNYCIITEFCEGGDLDSVIVSTKRGGAHLEEQRIMRWYIQILQGLDYIHRRKVLHRDLKPKNIFLKSDTVKIGDFGISRILNFTTDFASTFLGTPYYMSPEVLKHDGYNTTSDVWSSGVILYELCSLKHAFEGQYIMNIMMKILEEPCPKIPPVYSENLQKLIESILVKDPTNRPSASSILEMSYIKQIIQDRYMDLSLIENLSDTIVDKESQEISICLSKNSDLKVLNDETKELTPKEKFELKKKKKIDEEITRQKKLINETYKENKEKRQQIKANNATECLPFTKQRSENARSSVSEYDVKNLSWNCESAFSGSKTYVLSSNNERDITKNLSRSENIRNHFKSNPTDNLAKENLESGSKDLSGNDQPANRALQNCEKLYNITYTKIKFENPSQCNITTYNAAGDPLYHEEPNYSSDFESDCSSQSSQNDNESPNETLTTVPPTTSVDPYGPDSKMKKIETMRKKCLEKIDEITLTSGLEYMRNNYNRGDYIGGLRQICHYDDVAMMIDQIHFLDSPLIKLY